MLKVMTIVGTRPEIIRLSRIIALLDIYCDHYLVHTGQNYDYELNDIFFTELNIRRPDFYMGAAGSSAIETIGQVIISSEKVMNSWKPDAVLILGDTNSCLASIAAKRKRIPVFHLEAGNRCFDLRVPEEINRRIVDHTSDVHLTYSQIAKSYLIREGIAPDQVICVGSPMREVLTHYKSVIDGSTILDRLGLNPFQYYLVSCHREENVDSPRQLSAFVDVLSALVARGGLPVIVSTHPRMRNRINEHRIQIPDGVTLCSPFGFPDYIKLQMCSKAVLSDSGTITEESSILNVPALNLREVHERPEGFEEGAVMLVGLDVSRIMLGLDILEKQYRGSDRTLQMVYDYSTENVSHKILRILLSYTHYVDNRVWRKNCD